MCAARFYGGINTFGGLFFGPVFNTTTGIPLGFPGAGTPINLITGELGFGVGGDTYLEATTDVDLQTDSYSVFGQIDYDLTEQLMVNLGFRAIIEEKDYSYTNRLYFNDRDGRTSGAVFNADAEYYGFEAEVLTTPVDNLDIWLGLSYIDTEVKDLELADNASLTWYSPDGHWQVTGFVRNFSDSRAQNSAFDLAIVDGSDEQSFEKPRRYGVSLRYNY